MPDIMSTAYAHRPGSMRASTNGTFVPTPATRDYEAQGNGGALPRRPVVPTSVPSTGIAQDAAAAHLGISTFYRSSDGDPFHHGPGYR